MKIISFSFTVRQADTKDGYGDNYYVNIDKDGDVNVSSPYKTISHKEQAAILGIIQSGIVKYATLVNECDKANQKLKLEEYAESPETTSEEEKAIAAAKLSAKQELEATAESVAPQSCALGGGEVSTEDESLIGEGFQELDPNMG